MKTLDKPYADYWYGKKTIDPSIQTPDSNPDEPEDDQYRTLKKAIQQEAIQRWSRS